MHTIGKYRLDALLRPNIHKPHHKLLLLPFYFYPKTTLNRGEALRKTFEDLGPIFIKFGQLLSTRPDLVPYDVIIELNKLQDNVPPFDRAEFKRIVERELKDSTDTIFKHFDEMPLASASIAQVHRATLHSGEKVIVKAVRPNIEKTIKKDVTLLNALATLIEKISPQGKRLRPVEVVDDYKNTIFDELELAKEAANASQLKRNFEDSPLLYIPEVYWKYSTNKVMVVEYIDGIQIANIDALKAQGTDLKVLAERGVEIFFTQVFDHNFFHADMHPGNIFVSKENPASPSFMAVDMAIVGSLTRDDQYYLARNLLAMFRRDYRQVAELHVLSGWVPEHTSISGFESAIRMVCEPIFEKPLREISFGETLIQLFKTAQRYEMPVQPQLVLLQKTLLNIEGLGRQLYPDLDLWETAHPYLEKWIKNRFHPKTLVNNFKYNAPEWLEAFPKVPHLLFNVLETQEKINKQHIKHTEAQNNRSTLCQIVSLTGFVNLIMGIYFVAAPHILNDNMPAFLSNGGLIVLGVGLLIWSKFFS